MQKDRLFLLKPGFHDAGEGPFHCPECAQVTGLLEYHPQLRNLLDIQQVEFPRPRPAIVALLGPDHQSCPVLVLAQPPSGPDETLGVQQANGHYFVEGAADIALHLARRHGTSRPH